MKATVGRTVHYVLPDGTNRGDHRPAVVVRVWDQSAASIQLQVFTDGSNDGAHYAMGVAWKTSVHQDEEKKEPGTWHWPERNED
jgi:hypothetical protein